MNSPLRDTPEHSGYNASRSVWDEKGLRLLLSLLSPAQSDRYFKAAYADMPVAERCKLASRLLTWGRA